MKFLLFTALVISATVGHAQDTTNLKILDTINLQTLDTTIINVNIYDTCGCKKKDAPGPPACDDTHINYFYKHKLELTAGDTNEISRLRLLTTPKDNLYPTGNYKRSKLIFRDRPCSYNTESDFYVSSDILSPIEPNPVLQTDIFFSIRLNPRYIPFVRTGTLLKPKGRIVSDNYYLPPTIPATTIPAINPTESIGVALAEYKLILQNINELNLPSKKYIYYQALNTCVTNLVKHHQNNNGVTNDPSDRKLEALYTELLTDHSVKYSRLYLFRNIVLPDFRFRIANNTALVQRRNSLNDVRGVHILDFLQYSKMHVKVKPNIATYFSFNEKTRIYLDGIIELDVTPIVDSTQEPNSKATLVNMLSYGGGIKASFRGNNDFRIDIGYSYLLFGNIIANDSFRLINGTPIKKEKLGGTYTNTIDEAFGFHNIELKVTSKTKGNIRWFFKANMYGTYSDVFINTPRTQAILYDRFHIFYRAQIGFSAPFEEIPGLLSGFISFL